MIEAIKSVIKYDYLISDEQKRIDDELFQIPVDDEAIKQYVLNNHAKKKDKIFDETKKIIERKNNDDLKNSSDFLISRGILKLDNYVENVDRFYSLQPFFFDKSCCFWFWNSKGKLWEMVDETDMMNRIDSELNFGGQTVSKGLRGNYLEAFKRVGRKHIPKDPEKSWVQLKDQIFDTKSGKVFEASPEFFICNPISWGVVQDGSETPIIDALFESWVGKEYKKDLYQILAYCCTIDYPIHLVFCLVGSGRNGKSSFLQLLSRFIGQTNICSTELDTLLDNRFESSKLYKKLVCLLGETNFGILSKTSLLKRLTGQDLIGYEFKNKMPFDAYNYAKIVISSNSLPTTEDTSEGFFRRWHIINFPNEFPEGKNIIDSVPDSEFEALAYKIMSILADLLSVGHFINQGSIEDRKNRYIMNSNPLPQFIKQFCVEDPSFFVSYSELYMSYTKYLNINKKRIINKKEFSKILNQEGIESHKVTKNVDGEFISGYFLEGIKLKENILFNKETFDYPIKHIVEEEVKKMTDVTDMTGVQLSSRVQENKVEVVSYRSYRSFNENDLVFAHCAYPKGKDMICGKFPCQEFEGLPLCEEHLAIVIKERED
jgi:P4 family phage/plasmid primase-like protien